MSQTNNSTSTLEIEQEKSLFLLNLDETLLKGSAIISEWAIFLIRNADISFISGANLSAIITSLAAIETHLRTEDGLENKQFVDLITSSNLSKSLKKELHDLRKYRNKWVHVSSPSDDEILLNSSDAMEAELEFIARRSLECLRRVIYSNQGV